MSYHQASVFRQDLTDSASSPAPRLWRADPGHASPLVNREPRSQDSTKSHGPRSHRSNRLGSRPLLGSAAGAGAKAPGPAISFRVIDIHIVYGDRTLVGVLYLHQLLPARRRGSRDVHLLGELWWLDRPSEPRWRGGKTELYQRRGRRRVRRRGRWSVHLLDEPRYGCDWPGEPRRHGWGMSHALPPSTRRRHQVESAMWTLA